MRGIKDFKPFPTQVRPLSSSTGVIAESPRYPEAAPLNVDFIDSPIPSFGGQTVVYLPVHFDTATPTGPYTYGAYVTLKAVPSTGSVFAGWSGLCTGSTSTTCSGYMRTNYTATATFNRK